MYFIKKVSFFMLFFLIFISIYNDLSNGTSINDDKKLIYTTATPQETQSFTVIKVRIHSGDTVLSITEQINDQQINQLDIKQLMYDFQTINPQVDPYDLHTNHYYYFPLYE